MPRDPPDMICFCMFPSLCPSGAPLHGGPSASQHQHPPQGPCPTLVLHALSGVMPTWSGGQALARHVAELVPLVLGGLNPHAQGHGQPAQSYGQGQGLAQGQDCMQVRRWQRWLAAIAPRLAAIAADLT